MKKIFAIFLIFSLVIPQTFAQINFGSSEIQQTKIRGSQASADIAVQTLFNRTMFGIASGLVFVLKSGLISYKKAFFILGWVFMANSVMQFSLNQIISDSEEDSKSSTIYQKPDSEQSYTTYMTKSRDVDRMSKMRNLALGISAYYADNAKYPPEHASGCVPYWYLIIPISYIYKNGDFSDPKEGFMHDGCRDKNAKAPFAYRILKDKTGEEMYIVSANLESEKYGNSPYSIDEIVKNPELITKIQNNEFKGNGKYYIFIGN